MKKLNQTSTHRVFTDLLIRFEERKNKAFKVFVDSEKSEVWYTTFAQDAITKGMCSWFIEHDLAAAKQWFYVAAKCIAISTTKPVGFASLWTSHDFMFPLLSDSREIIKLFSEIEIPAITRPEHWQKGRGQDSLLAQLAIKGDDTQISTIIDKLEVSLNQKKKPKEDDDGGYDDVNISANQPEYNLRYIQFYRGLIEGNMQTMQESLNWLGQQKQNEPVTEDFLAFHAVVMCKLAWLRGYEVHVDSPLVPMEFMPVAPLAHYDDVYEFLKPDWVAPPPPTSKPEKKPSLLAKLFGK